jgi:hypothetical protein
MNLTYEYFWKNACLIVVNPNDTSKWKRFKFNQLPAQFFVDDAITNMSTNTPVFPQGPVKA